MRNRMGRRVGDDDDDDDVCVFTDCHRLCMNVYLAHVLNDFAFKGDISLCEEKETERT